MDERPDDDLRMQFEAITRFDDEKRVVRSLLEGMILKHEAGRWQALLNSGEGSNGDEDDYARSRPRAH